MCTLRLLSSLLHINYGVQQKICHNYQPWIKLFASQIDLGERLLPAFDSRSNIPYSDVNLLTHGAHAPRWGPDSSVSEVSTIQLEFRDLTYTTGDSKYKVLEILMRFVYFWQLPCVWLFFWVAYLMLSTGSCRYSHEPPPQPSQKSWFSTNFC